MERVILPDSTINVDYCVRKFTNIMDKLLVYPDAMLANMGKTGGLIYSQRILLAIVSKGVLREDAYAWVQRNAMKRWLEKEDFKTNVEKDADITKYQVVPPKRRYDLRAVRSVNLTSYRSISKQEEM